MQLYEYWTLYERNGKDAFEVLEAVEEFFYIFISAE
jgi:hypothetical protein